MAYATYDSASVMHQTAVNELHLLLGQAGVLGSTADEAALGAIRQQMDVEAIAVGFRDSFFLICVCFLVAMIPMLCLLRHRLRLPHLAAP
jgi:hypothetical protein